MTPSELAARLKQKLAHFEEDWDPEDVKSLAEFVIENGTALLAALDRAAGPVEDAERLDWLQANRATIWWGGIINRRDGNVPHAAALEWLEGGDLVNQSERFETLRDAIDAARAAQKGKA